MFELISVALGAITGAFNPIPPKQVAVMQSQNEIKQKAESRKMLRTIALCVAGITLLFVYVYNKFIKK